MGFISLCYSGAVKSESNGKTVPILTITLLDRNEMNIDLESQRMDILLTNDDGIAAPGLWAAAQVLAGMGRVTIVAPATNYSGYGAALPPARSLSYTAYRPPDGHPANVRAFGLAATPASCALVGLSGVLGGGPFDLVVSGINHGVNLGRDIFYSGTVGAALTAHLLDVPAIAISLDVDRVGVAHWDTAAWALSEVIRLWQANPEPTPVVFNVNVPNLPVSALDGTLITSPANDSCLTKYRFAADPHIENTLAIIRQDGEGYAPEPWSDAWAVELGYVSITPFRAVPDLLCVIPWTAPSEAIALPLLSVAEMAE
jgi:5'-nucleotidase